MSLVSSHPPVLGRARTKIVATVGPACFSLQQLSKLISTGVDVFRINMAHGDTTQHDEVLANIRAASKELDRPVGVLVDLAGPKIRLGQLVEDPVSCELDAEFTFVRGADSSNANELTTNYPLLVDELNVDDRVLLADGSVGMRVIQKLPDRVDCVVYAPGILRSRQGVNLPGVKLSVPSITKKDRQSAVWAAKNHVDFVSLSFVRSAAEIRELKEMLRELGNQAMTIAKIEKPEALDCLEEIVLASDGVMVARGDLGVEIEIERTPVEQKRIIDTCARLRRPVIVATQMLDSMQASRRPTRAEASDVANAILDGTDACMLSGETAIGKYPVESVSVMNRIMQEAEGLLVQRSLAHSRHEGSSAAAHPVTEAVVYGAGQIAERLKAKVVAVRTHSGRTALAKSKQRDVIPTIGVSDQDETLRRMTLFWGIEPVVGAPTDENGLRQFIDEWGKAHNALQVDDLVVLLASGDFARGAHNRIVVHKVT